MSELEEPITDEDLPLNHEFSGYNSEKKLEKAFCNWIINNSAYRLIGRQLPTITGILDVLAFQVNPDNPNEFHSLHVFELKNRKLKSRDVDQVLRYARELEGMLKDLIPITNMLNSLGLAIKVGLVGKGVSQKVHKYLNTSINYPIDIFLAKDNQFGFEYFDHNDTVITDNKPDYIDYLLSKLSIPIQQQFLLEKDRLIHDMEKLRDEYDVTWSEKQKKEARNE